MKRKFLLSAFLFASTLRGYAQDARGAMNQILDGYTLSVDGKAQSQAVLPTPQEEEPAPEDAPAPAA